MQKSLAPAFAAIGAVAILAPNMAWTHPVDQSPPHMMWWGGGWYGMWLGPVFMILGLAVAIALALLLARLFGAPFGSASPPSKTALDILKERFAKGEIDKDEYDARRKVLGD